MSTVEDFQVNAVPRSDTGKGASRRLRRTGQIPGILYGGQDKEPTMISVRFNEMYKHLESEAFYSHILTVKVGSSEQAQAVLKDVQRHPASGEVLHFDLQRISASEKLTMSVPLHFINEEKCIGVKQHGGVISHQLTEVEVRCLPKDLPEFIEIDMSSLDVGDVLHLSSITWPDGVECIQLSHGEEHDLPVVSVLGHGSGHGSTEELKEDEDKAD